MAYVNVREWSPDQVTEWLRGLDNIILPYINSFLNNEVKGHQLLSLRSDDLEHLGVYTLGHQELILEAVEHLRNFHYELDRENLQLLALRLSCAAQSLYNELLSSEDANRVETQTMSDVANIVTTIKPLVCWLDRAPFSGQGQYLDRKTSLLQLSLEMATCAQRDRFADQPVEKIRSSCQRVARLADNIIQEMSDPMILQPASLDLATLKKKENELGFALMPSFHGVHQIAEIKFTSPAHASSKLEEGDEIVQVNYQTVVGWQRKKVLLLFQESPPDIVLTLKKRPRHTKVYGQIYMKPYRLPSKKRATPYSRWNDNLPSPRPELLTIPDFEMPLPRLPPATQAQPLESESSSDSEPPDSPLEPQGRVYPLKPRPVLQRRNTITGASPTSKRPHQAIEQYWNELKHQAAYKHSSSTYIETDNYKRDSVYLRDKSASCGHGLELTPRPATYPKKFDKSLLLAPTTAPTDPATTAEHNNTTTNNNKPDTKKRVNFDDRKVVAVSHDQWPEEKKRQTELSCIQEISAASSELSNQCTSNNSVVYKDTTAAAAAAGVTEQNLEKSISVNSLTSLAQCDEPIKFIDETVDEMYDRSHMNAGWKHEIIEELIGSLKKSCLNLSTTVATTTAAANKTPTNSPERNDDMKPMSVRPSTLPRSTQTGDGANKVMVKKPPPPPPEIPAKPDILRKPAVPPRSFTTRITRGRLDKSHSTPAYDTTQESVDIDIGGRMPEILVTAPELSECPKPKETSTTTTAAAAAASYDVRFNTWEKVTTSTASTTVIQTKLTSIDTQVIETVKSVVDTPPEPPPRVVYPPESPAKLKHFDARSIAKVEFASVVDTHKAVAEVSRAGSSFLSKNRGGKKRNNLIAKRRKVAVKELTPCDFLGYLYQRLRKKHTQHFHWEKRWFVLLGSCLYGFKAKEALKAECLIFLTGFTVAIAHEVKSRTNAFKVYHTGTAFYFSAENCETMTVWVELITAATLLHSDGSKPADSALFSETDDSDAEKPTKPAEGNKEKTESGRKFGSIKKFTSRKSSTSTTTSTTTTSTTTSTTTTDTATTHGESTTSLDRKYLRFFNNPGPKAAKNQMPVPTPQFRSYRKVVPPNLVVSQHMPPLSSSSSRKPDIVTVSSTSVTSSSSSTLNELPCPAAAAAAPKPMKLKPKNVFNYIHASNPSICDNNDYRFYNKTRQFAQRTENLAGFVTLEQFMLDRQEEERRQNQLFGRHDDVHINPNSIQPDVVYGEVRTPYSQSGDSRTFDSKAATKPEQRKLPEAAPHMLAKLTHARTNSDGYTDLFYDGKHHHLHQHQPDVVAAQSKTLPKTGRLAAPQLESASGGGSLPRSPEHHHHHHHHHHQHQQHHHHHRRSSDHAYDDRSELVADIKMSEPYELQYADKKSLRLQKLTTEPSAGACRDRSSYEMIHCPQQRTNDVQFAQNRTLDAQKKCKLIRQHSLNAADRKDSKIFNRGGESAEQFWLDSLRRSDKIADKATAPATPHAKVKLKSVTQYTPLCLPLAPDHKLAKLNPKFAFELNLDEKSAKGGKFKGLFGKQADERKEKTLLGSPRLHRALFRKQNSSSTSSSNSGGGGGGGGGQEADWCSEAPQAFTTSFTPAHTRTGLLNTTTSSAAAGTSVTMSPPPDYPGLEYPPVFEPETYSLANPSCSLTLLRKQQQQ